MDLVITVSIRESLDQRDAMREMNLVRGPGDWTWWTGPPPGRSVILLGLPGT